jgi:hypothetical protein
MRPDRVLIVLPLLLSTLPAAAQDSTPRRPGLWEMSVITIIQSQKSAPQVSQHCIDAATDQAMRSYSLALIQSKCDRTDWRREGNKRVLYAGCKAGDQRRSRSTAKRPAASRQTTPPP